MASKLNPYISFDGNAREAMEYYNSVLGGDLRINTFGEYGDKDAPGADRIMHAMLETKDGLTLMASDTQPGMEHNPGNNITISLSGEDAESLRSYWDKLSADGTVTVPLEKQMWGDEFGACTDKYGIAWMVDIVPPKA